MSQSRLPAKKSPECNQTDANSRETNPPSNEPLNPEDQTAEQTSTRSRTSTQILYTNIEHAENSNSIDCSQEIQIRGSKYDMDRLSVGNDSEEKENFMETATVVIDNVEFDQGQTNVVCFEDIEDPFQIGVQSTSLYQPQNQLLNDTTNYTEQKIVVDGDEGAAGGLESADCDTNEKEQDEKESKKRKNRCGTCRKKLGLTGFQCRCGGLFCAQHRYSDKHDCSFNYREMGAQEIRRNNPVVVGEKIQKI